MDLSNCKTSQETLEAISKHVLATPVEDVKIELSKRFYDIDSIVDFLYITLTSKGNGILHGPGGFGKSEITKAFLEYFDIQSLVIVGHSAMDVEALLGIPNIKKLTEESTYEIAFEKSVFNTAGVLILEEFLDVKPTVAAALKDILTSRGYRQGSNFVPSKIGSVIICSNKTPEEVSTDLSTAAFYKERFPFSMFVCWEDFSVDSYRKFYKTITSDYESKKNELEILSQLCSRSCTEDQIISPRIAIEARNALLISGKLHNLQFINSLDYGSIEEIQYQLLITKQSESLTTRFDALNKQINAFEISSADDYSAFLHLSDQIYKTISNSNIVGDVLIAKAALLRKTIDLKLIELRVDVTALGVKHYYTSMNNLKKEHDEIAKYFSS